MTLRVSRLLIYPLKSAAGIELDNALVTGEGLAMDRRWMLVDESGKFLSQRQYARMALIRVSLKGGLLICDAAGMTTLLVQPENPYPLTVTIWEDTVDAETVSRKADDWFSRFLGQPVRLVHFPESRHRHVDSSWAGEGHFTAFSDGFPFLVLTQESLDALSVKWGKPVSWQRFRPNILIAGASAPFAEDGWKSVTMSGMTFSLVKPCSRCVIPSIDPETAGKDRDLMDLLIKTRQREDGKIYLGQNAVLSSCGASNLLRTGEKVIPQSLIDL